PEGRPRDAGTAGVARTGGWRHRARCNRRHPGRVEARACERRASRDDPLWPRSRLAGSALRLLRFADGEDLPREFGLWRAAAPPGPSDRRWRCRSRLPVRVPRLRPLRDCILPTRTAIQQPSRVLPLRRVLGMRSLQLLVCTAHDVGRLYIRRRDIHATKQLLLLVHRSRNRGRGRRRHIRSGHPRTRPALPRRGTMTHEAGRISAPERRVKAGLVQAQRPLYRSTTRCILLLLVLISTCDTDDALKSMGLSHGRYELKRDKDGRVVPPD